MLIWTPSIAVALVLGLAVALATCVRVWRGGTTLNDHLVAAVVTGCVAVYPLLWWGAESAGVHGVARGALAVLLVLGASGIYGLFHVLDMRRDPGLLVWWARLAQPAYAFALWTGLLLVFWFPAAVFLGLPVLWPGPLLLLPLVLAGWGTVWTYWQGGAVREFALAAPDLDREVRLVHLSDLHVSPCMTVADMRRLVAQVQALKPDLVAVTGDMVMPFSEDEHQFLLDTLSVLDVPVVACLGNHDLPIKQRLVDEFTAAGMPLLVDQALVVQVGDARIEVVGVDFHWKDARGRLTRALEALPPAPADARVLLAHDPRLFRWVPADRFDLVLSGHTHGGQVGTDMFGLGWSVLRPLGVFDQGHWRKGHSVLYVHRGNWHTGLPPRMGIAAEVVVHRLGVDLGDMRPRAREVST